MYDIMITIFSNIAVYTIAEVFLLLQMLDNLVIIIIISTPHEKQQQTSRRKRGFALTIIITGRKNSLIHKRHS
jgi:hypothetical protein